ncbi:MAG: hypothetical protein LBT91_01775 [Bifidobacteriaceae bacterium]|jgi:PDZ domain-containing protein|nr:hypothetical protein [Bifidobacteriaceae bacterium]
MPRNIGFFLRTGLVLISLLILFTPLPYCIESPGLAQNVLGKYDNKELIQIEGYNSDNSKNHNSSEDSSSPKEKLLMTTVSVLGNAKFGIFTWQILLNTLNSESVLLPLEAVYPQNATEEQYKEQTKKMMTDSQNTAITAAYKYLKMEKYPKTVISIDNIGGPSAGLMFALGIINIIKQTSLAGNNIIAGTGQITADGQIQAIGGIDQKIFTARTFGAKYFLAPKSNCSDILAKHDGIKIIAVSKLSQTVDILDNIKNNKLETLPTCES